MKRNTAALVAHGAVTTVLATIAAYAFWGLVMGL